MLALSYEQIAQRLGIATASARRLVQRRRWLKDKGNDGR
jgi:DNA-directed RNA polymerase specialized sigma24 family protein